MPQSNYFEYAVAAEKAGFDLLDVSDHFHPWSEAGQCPFTWTWLGATAVQTSKIQVGTGVTCPILRYHPAIIAQAAATVSCFAPRRTYLGVGTGEALNEYAVTREWPEHKERLERLEEAIQLIRALWSGQEVSFNGIYYQTQKAKLYTPPAAPIPIYISALVPHSAAFAGKYGDGLFSVGGKKPELYRQMIQSFENGAREAGKDPSRMPRLIELNVAYTDKIDAAIQEQIKYWAGTYIPALFVHKIYTPTMSQENGEVVGPRPLRRPDASHPVPMIISSLYNSTSSWDLTLLSFTCPGQISVLLLNAMAVIYCQRYALWHNHNQC